MRVMLALGCTAVLIAVAACNREEAPPGNDRAEAVENGSTNVSTSVAAPTDVAAFMHDRHERYEDLGDEMKGLNRELKASSPSVAAIQRHAAAIAEFAPQVPSLFPAGTGPETGRRTRAKAEIWTDSRTFSQRAKAFRVESARFNEVAQSGDLAAIRAAVPRLSEACKNCHDRFRAPESGH